jgi:thermostable 8-oxoguanine DNA glycosylase
MTARLVDPFNFTKFDRTDAELEAMLLFSIMVANKRADQTYAKFEAFLSYGPPNQSPFGKVEWMLRRGLVRYLRIVRAGQYARIAAAFRGVLSLNLRTCTVADLEAVHGIGPKTARMFLLHSRPAQRVAVLDTHILAWLAQCGVADVPRSTPPAGKHYERLELAFLDLCDKAGADPASLDLTIWADRTLSKIAA